MAGGKPIRPTTNTQARSKEKKKTGSKDGPEQASPSESSNMVVESPGGGDVDDFEDDPTVWNPIASQLSKAIENVKKPDHWPRDFARSVKDRQSALVEELKVKSQALRAAQQTFASQFHKIIDVALAPAAGSEPASSSAAPHPLQNINHLLTPATACQPLHQKATALLEESKTLLAQYHQHLLLTQQQQHQQSSEPNYKPSSSLEDLATNFAAAKHHTAQAIAAGRRVADADVDDMLADRLHKVRGGGQRPPLTAAEEMLGREVLRLGRGQRPELASAAGAGTEDDGDGDGVVCWGQVAHRAQKAVETLVRVSAMEE